MWANPAAYPPMAPNARRAIRMRRRMSHPPFVRHVTAAAVAATTAEEATPTRLDEVGEGAALPVVERLVDGRERLDEHHADLGERSIGLAADALGRRAVERVAAEQAGELRGVLPLTA